MTCICDGALVSLFGRAQHLQAATGDKNGITKHGLKDFKLDDAVEHESKHQPEEMSNTLTIARLCWLAASRARELFIALAIATPNRAVSNHEVEKETISPGQHSPTDIISDAKLLNLTWFGTQIGLGSEPDTHQT